MVVNAATFTVALYIFCMLCGAAVAAMIRSVPMNLSDRVNAHARERRKLREHLLKIADENANVYVVVLLASQYIPVRVITFKLANLYVAAEPLHNTSSMPWPSAENTAATAHVV